MTEIPAPSLPHCVILGGGGHTRVLIDCIQEGHQAEVVGVLDRDSERHGETLLGVPILGDDGLLGELVRQGVTHFAVGLGGVGDNRPRRGLFEMGIRAGLVPLAIRHPSCLISRWSSLGEGCQLLPGCVVNAGATLGRNVIVNSAAVVEHDCTLGDHVHMATGARLASTVRIGDLAHIGAGATIRQCLMIGEGAIVGAGAVVLRDVEPWSVVAGVPAKPLPGGSR